MLHHVLNVTYERTVGARNSLTFLDFPPLLWTSLLFLLHKWRSSSVSAWIRTKQRVEKRQRLT